jgi:chromosome partitioning protein
VVPVQPTPADLWATEATLVLAQAERVSAIVVLNRVPPRARLTGEIAAILGGLDVQLAESRLGNRVAFAESLGIGSTALETRRTGVAAAEARALAGELLQALD